MKRQSAYSKEVRESNFHLASHLTLGLPPRPHALQKALVLLLAHISSAHRPSTRALEPSPTLPPIQKRKQAAAMEIVTSSSWLMGHIFHGKGSRYGKEGLVRPQWKEKSINMAWFVGLGKR